MAYPEMICWEENGVKRWEMIKSKDREGFLMDLVKRYDKGVSLHSIFIMPTNGFLGALWLWTKTHKSHRVDFYKFFEDYGEEYTPPEISKESKEYAAEVHEKREANSKYGFISPDGRHFACPYQGHSSLAYDICFGMVDTNNSERYLEEHGWCKVYKPLFSGSFAVYVGEGHTLTDEQLNTLIEMGLEDAHGVSELLEREKYPRM